MPKLGRFANGAVAGEARDLETQAANLAWISTILTQLVNDAETRRLVCAYASDAGEAIAILDLESSIPYLRKCLENCSPDELEAMSRVRAAALWARGALGARKWRTSRS